MVFQVKMIQEHRLNPSSNSRVKNIVTPESQALERTSWFYPRPWAWWMTEVKEQIPVYPPKRPELAGWPPQISWGDIHKPGARVTNVWVACREEQREEAAFHIWECLEVENRQTVWRREFPYISISKSLPHTFMPSAPLDIFMSLILSLNTFIHSY